MTGPAPLLIHIGLHKTGSTWLQDHIFGHGDHGFAVDESAPRHRLVDDLVTPDPLVYDAQEVAEAYREVLRRTRSRGETHVLSHERLSGYPSSGGRDRAMIAQRLRETFPEARILMVIREQRSLIASMYSQHIADGGVESLQRFLEVPEPALTRKPSFSFAYYEFDRLIALYQRLFGQEKVLVLPVERLASDVAGFVGAIASFCGQPLPDIASVPRANERRPLMMQLCQRPLNFLLYHNELSPGALVHITRFHKRFARLRPVFDRLSPTFLEKRLDRGLRSAIDAHVGEYFARSNARTEALTGLDLLALGYPVARS